MAKFASVADMFRNRVKTTPDLLAFEYRENGAWRGMAWKEVGDKVRIVASGLRSLGLEDEQRVSILCSTRVDWLLADLGVAGAGGATTTIYPSTTPDGVQYILADSGSVVAIAENDGQVAKLLAVREQIPDVKTVVNMDGGGSEDGWIISWTDLEERGKAYDAANPDAYDEVIDRITPDKLATLIYTSGTTGNPKGVELINDCWLYTGEALDELGILSSKDKQFLWLPLSHSFGKVLETIIIALGVPTAIDGEIARIVANCGEVKPTFMGAAPRIFEKAYNKIVNGAKSAGGLKWAIFRWSADVGRQVSRVRQKGKEPSGLLALKHGIADKLVLSKIRAIFGGRIRFLISGSAPLNRDIAEFFHGAGLLILEGYGLTESSAASFINHPDSNRFGTVGKPLPGTEVKIAEDGEILFKSRGIMRGYYNLPEATAETLDDGWLHTGDIGVLDADGSLRITDRKKDLIKTSGGKYVAPQPIEGAFKAVSPLASQILVHGNARNFCSALVTMDPDAISAWAAANGLEGKSYEELAGEEKVRALFQGYFDEVNGGLARYETIKKFAVLPADFCIEDGTMTPSMKVKRKAIEAKYKDTLDGFYTDAMAST